MGLRSFCREYYFPNFVVQRQSFLLRHQYNMAFPQSMNSINRKGPLEITQQVAVPARQNDTVIEPAGYHGRSPMHPSYVNQSIISSRRNKPASSHTQSMPPISELDSSVYYISDRESSHTLSPLHSNNDQSHEHRVRIPKATSLPSERKTPNYLRRSSSSINVHWCKRFLSGTPAVILGAILGVLLGLPVPNLFGRRT